jgi:hypothetical protein
MHSSTEADALAATSTTPLQQQQQQSLYLHDYSLPQNCGVECSLLTRDFQVTIAIYESVTMLSS